jgi:hypothetical protein
VLPAVGGPSAEPGRAMPTMETASPRPPGGMAAAAARRELPPAHGDLQDHTSEQRYGVARRPAVASTPVSSDAC